MNDKKVIWITGASSGIGKSLALKFANNGWMVAASARRENLLQELHNENENIHSFPLDVTNSEQCKTVFDNMRFVCLARVYTTQNLKNILIWLK
jgi:NADP-dependent 3-hydroxy acid dehydrogenase YdfG